MTRKEFNKSVSEISSIALSRSNELLKRVGNDLSVVIDWQYNFEGDLEDAIGVYEAGGVFSGEMMIGFNMKNLYRQMVYNIKSYPWSDPYKMLNELIMTNVYHEVGHGIIELINDYLQNTDDLDVIYDNNQELFDGVLDDEEDAVEEFAWCVYDGELEGSRLWKIVELYVGLYEGGDDRVVEGYLRKIVEDVLKRELV